MLAMTDPVTTGEFVEQGPIQAARCPEVGVLDDGILAQSRLAQPPAETFVVACSYFTVEQQAEPILTGEIGRSGLHLEERIGHGGHAEAAQALSQGMHQHRCLSFQW
jgi:hypothetical protein